jgi:hypothetical protein
MAVTQQLTPSQQQSILISDIAAVAAIGSTAISGSIDTSKFVFFGAFDGTGNTLNDDTPQTNDVADNVSALWKQYEVLRGGRSNLQGNYYPGPGTDTALADSDWNPSQVTAEAIRTANNAYDDFATQANDWLRANPGQKIDPQIVVACFSRGDGALSFFSQLLYEKGLVDNSGNVIIPPGVLGISAGVLYDPVTTGTDFNLAQAPTSKDVVDIYARAEYRNMFKGTNYSAEQFVQTIGVIGNHCDIGGGYFDAVDTNGNLAATQH